MNKLVIIFAVASTSAIVAVAQPQQGASKSVQFSPPADTTIVRDLKEQDREIYDRLKKQGGKSGVISSTVVVSDTGEESIAPNINVKGSGPAPAAKNKIMVAAPSGSKDANLKPTAGDESLTVVKSTPPALDALDSKAIKSAASGVPAALTPKAARQAKPSSEDRLVPEAGIRMVEKITNKEVTERMIPPPDDLLLGAIKRPETRSESRGDATDKAIVIETIQGVNEIVTIGKNDLNRFVTPFESIKIRTAAAEDELVSKVDGNVVYLGATKRSGVFISEIGTDRAISLTLVPDDVPPRDIYLKFNRSSNIPSQLTKMTKVTAKSGGDGDHRTGKTQSHVDVVKDLFREIALGKIPSGYNLTPPKAGEFKCHIPGFRMRLGQSIEGARTKVMVFRAENSSQLKEAVIDEQYCYKRGVVAISAWPDVVVGPGEATEVFVMINVDDGPPPGAERPSLIGRESQAQVNED